METKDLDYPKLAQGYTITDEGVVYNEVGKALKPDVDKRRPKQPSALYLKCADGSRLYLYLEEVVAEYFCPGYNKGDCIIHNQTFSDYPAFMEQD